MKGERKIIYGGISFLFVSSFNLLRHTMPNIALNTESRQSFGLWLWYVKTKHRQRDNQTRKLETYHYLKRFLQNLKYRMIWILVSSKRGC
jgi:hypothetical protein